KPRRSTPMKTVADGARSPPCQPRRRASRSPASVRCSSASAPATPNPPPPPPEDAGGGRRALPAVSPTSTSISLTGLSPWLFRVCPSDAASSRAAARYVLDSLGFKRASIMYRNDSYGRGWTAAFTQAFTAGGGVVLEKNPHLADMNEWRAYAGVIKLTN